MKKEFSFYEFVGVIVPSVILLFFANEMFSYAHEKPLVDFSQVGDTTVFLIVSYGFGHLIHALGNIFEKVLWGIFGGMPTKWLPNGNRFKKGLLHKSDEEKITKKLYDRFGEADKDYGRLVYNVLYHAGKTSRIDIFNGNYSLFRGLTISFFLLTVLCWYFLCATLALVALGLAGLSLFRMVRFAKLYAIEVFVTYLNMSET